MGIFCLVTVAWFWLRVREDAAKSNTTAESGNAPRTGSLFSSNVNTSAGGQPGPGQPATIATGGTVQTGAAAPYNGPAAALPSQVPYRLSNTDQPLSELGRSDSAILLENALIDTASPSPLAVPEHLRASGDPGSYLVQSRRPLDKAFYTRLREAGAEFVSYIPNNAALVRVSANGARLLAAMPGTQAVLPYEPYYKLARVLLPVAVQQQSLPLDQPLNVTLFPGTRDDALTAMRNLGAEPIAEETVPSGPMLTVQVHPDSLVALAQLPGVQRIELARARVLLNDLSRTRMNVSSDTVVPNNYLDLTGTNVTLNLNDTGTDQLHPDLAGRVFFSNTDTNSTLTMQDPDGHGTHVAGTIISSGASSTNLVTPPPGSVQGANFRGMAPAARLLVLPIDLRVGPLVSDTYLQHTAASNNFVGLGRTNAIISNNSWAYNGDFEYSSASASYDAAVRDALPGRTGPQPVLYVFAAGNSGNGDDSGTVGEPDSIPAPATAKNVITVGAIEQLRNITNSFTTDVVEGTNTVTITNTPFLGFTDSANVVASFSSRGNVGIGIEGVFGRVKPDVVAPGAFVVSTRSSSWLLNYSLPPTDPRYPILSSLNDGLAPNYRYETGTSMAAPGVSGVLALMQEFFEQRLKLGYSPALLKALLINGARSVNPDIPKYDFSVTNNVKIQGWGLVNLTNSLPAALTNTDHTTWPLQLFDQSPTNTLSTGQRHTRELGLSPDGQRVPLRVTLVWTDPPGNPGAGIKLVNDLDLVVTNLDTGEVFLGNGIPSGFSFNPPSNTNAPAGFDFVNNVENVILRPPLGTNYSITVVGRRVNVNAVSANTNDVVQDYALVVACGDGELASPIVSLTDPVANVIPAPSIIVITNGVQLLHQRVGANFQLAPLPDGEAEQWRFYVFTNFFFTNTPSGLINGSNVAFITFPDGNLSLPRNLGPDIDLYVSADPALTNLNGFVVASAFKSLNRGGIEAVVFTNAPVGPDAVFYIGVKSEDQQAADFGIVGFSSDEHFADQDSSGNHILRGLPPSAAIPDGSADAPGGVRIFAVDPLQPITISRVIVTNDITHQSTGDLVGNLSYGNHFAVLNNHNRYGGLTNTFFHLVYDDSNSGEFYLSRPTDGPGSLNNFVGESTGSTMPWMFTMTDNSRSRTGRIESLNIRVEPNQSILGTSQRVCVLANQWDYHFVDVPPDGSKLTVIIANNTAPVDLYIKRGVQPTATDFDKFALISPPGGSLSIGLGDVPPLNAGRYFIGVFNPNASTECFDISSIIDQNPAAVRAQTYLPTNSLSLLDDAITSTSIVVTNNRNVADVQVGVRVNHARASDLVFHLVSPQGTRILLSENRGQDNTVGYGLGSGMSTNAITNVVATVMEDGFENATEALNVPAGSFVSGWHVDQDNIDVLGPNLFPALGLAHSGAKYIDIQGNSPGIISTNINTTPGTPYRLSFAYTLNPESPGPASANINVNGSTLLNILAPVDNALGNLNWKTTSVVFTASTLLTKIEVASAAVSHPFHGVFFDTFKVEELSITTPLLYTIFTENTNLTTTPIKFGIAPFASTNGLSTNLVYTNSFEAIRPDDYCAVTNFGAWQLYSNHVTVVNNVLESHTGANYLKLNNGQVLLTLPTSPGKRYQLQHVFRRDPPDPSLVSWWPAEGDANDIVSTNNGTLFNGVSFTNGMAGQAFSFDGVDDFVSFGNAIGNFGTNDFTVEFWIKTTSARVEAILAKRPICGRHESFFSLRLFSGRVGVELEGDPAGNVHVGNKRVNDGIIHHIAVVRQSTNAALYVDGVLDMSNSTPSVTSISNNVALIAGVDACVGVDGTAPFTGQLDEVSIFTRALPLSEIRAIYLAGITAGAGKCGAQTLPFSTPISWWPAEGNANDISDGNPGTLSGGVTFAGGLVGRAFNFGGTGGVRINNNLNLNFRTNLTMETWVLPTKLDGEMDTILYKEADSANPEQYAMAIKGPLNVSCPGGAITNGHFAFALVGVAGLPNEFCGWVDGGGIVPTNQWTHLAVTFDGSTARAFINGALTRTLTNLSGGINVSSGSLWIGSRSPVITGPFPSERFNGLIDETALYDHALDSCEIRDIYEANVKGKYSLLGRPAPCPVNVTVTVDDRLTNTFGSSDWRTWQTNVMRFSATQIGTPLQLIAHEPEMQFDTFELSELSSGNYYLPEESLNTLLGESALGTWTLEVWDNRLGALINPAPDLLSWQLQFIFSNTNPPAIPLTFVPPTTNVASVYTPNGVLVTNVVVGGQIRYFTVDVPRRATIATNLLTVLSGQGDLALWYNPDALPTANPAVDVGEDRNGILPALADETLLLNLTTPPVLRPGQRYYLGVTNKTIPSTNTFLISVAFDQTDTNLISVRTLTNGSCYTATIPVTNALDYYQFTVSTNSTIVNFALSPANPDANLVVRRALPVPDPLPRPNTGKFDYISVNGGIANDIITVTADSQPVPLSPGLWYLGVFNVATNPVTYTICATESTNGLYNIIPLTNAVPLDYTIGAGSLLTNLFLFTIDQTNSAVLFELYNLNSDAELLAALGTFPTPATAQFADLASPVKIGQIVARTNDFFPTLNGNWYLAVDNLQNGNLTFTISAVVSTNGILSSRLPMTIAIGFAPPPDIGLQFTWYSVLGETYVIETSDDLVTWTLLDTIVAYSSYTTYTDPAGGTQPYLFYRIRQVP
jgi:subtilisin family serine protease/subtilisin-like proprotein convertase family protein